MYQIGALFYIAWGGLHLWAAYLVYRLGSRQPAGMVRGRVLQGAWNLVWLAVLVMVVAAIYNWRNDGTGYWLNLALTSITDIGFIVFVLAPKYLPLRAGILGPVLWVLAIIFSTLGIFASPA
jgi:hypothetical protein